MFVLYQSRQDAEDFCAWIPEALAAVEHGYRIMRGEATRFTPGQHRSFECSIRARAKAAGRRIDKAAWLL